MRITTLEQLKALGRDGLRLLYPRRIKISVGVGSCGLASGARDVLTSMDEAVRAHGIDVALCGTGCVGFCQQEPLVDVLVPGTGRTVYHEMTPEKGRELVRSIAQGDMTTEWALCRMVAEDWIIDGTQRELTSGGVGEANGIPLYQELPFFQKQRKIVLRNCGFIDPMSLEQYIARGGYQALYDVLTGIAPEKVIEQIGASGLRGRGGAGFPTARKWQACREAPGEVKYLVCNADEGDPGAYMDRSILEGDPHSVLEGMLIGAYAIGAHKGYIYVRAEYPLAIQTFEAAMEAARERGLLGHDILGTGFDFDLELVRGAGAFVCGEETALLASIEGTVGEPRQRPPFPAHKGLWEQPTNINNVKTWANVPVIMRRGPEWFAEMGTEQSKGTMVFSLVGKIANTGLVEVPMGISLSELVYDIGGGTRDDKRFKAVQTGGPSGGCIPAELVHLPVDYERLTEAGSMMGSGGMVVMDEDTCMVDMARYFLTFTKDESCGKCTPCREGTRHMLDILTRICEGEGRQGDIEMLEQVAQATKEASLCGLGQTAPNPVLSTIRYFRDEYEAHIKYKKCPAAVCNRIVSSPCHYSCPLGTDVPSYIALIAQGRFTDAADLIRQENPLPVICGRVCHHPCEKKCRSGEFAEPIAVKALKRFVTDYERREGIQPRARAAGRRYDRVAIVGAGPAGLTAGYYLAQRGYEPTIFEAQPIAGGMLALGIPEYRLPRDILNAELEQIQRSGVEVRSGMGLGRDFTLDDLFTQGYKAVFIAVGAHKSLKLGVPGEDAEGVLDPLVLLRDVSLGQPVSVGRRVAVIGGGDAAIDAARTAHRLGAESVSIVYRRTRAEMPAGAAEVEAALQEGIDISFLAAPTRVLTENGRVTGIECQRMQLGDLDSSGRRRPVPIEGSEFTLEIDTLIPAIGQEPDLSWVRPEDGLEVSEWGTLAADPETLATSWAGVFAGGDALTGPASVTDAMAAGKVAAESIHRYLRGEPLEREYDVVRPAMQVDAVQLTDEEIETMARPEMPCVAVAERAGNFREVEQGFTQEAAAREARRCMRCDTER